MIRIFTKGNADEDFYIVGYGHSSPPDPCRWGKGVRDLYFLHYVLNGEGIFNGTPVKQGEGFYISANMVQEYYPSENNPWGYFWITFNGNRADEICKKHIQIDENGIFKFPLNRSIQALMNRIFDEDTPMNAAKALGYFYMLMAEQEVSAPHKGNMYVENAKNYIRINYSQNPMITEIAQALNIDDRYLYNLFMRYEGLSPKKYLNQIKLRRACELLERTDAPIAEVAASVGFSDSFSFSKFFTKHMHLSPTAYRKHAVKEK